MRKLNHREFRRLIQDHTTSSKVYALNYCITWLRKREEERKREDGSDRGRQARMEDGGRERMRKVIDKF